MSEDRRRRVRLTGNRRGRVGEPNVLSNAAVPNQLSEMATPSGSGSPASAQQAPATRSADAGATTSQSPGSWLGSGQVASGPRIRLSISTLLFVGFLLLTLFRGLGELLSDSSNGDSTPSTAPLGSLSVAPGVITFGTGPAGDCTILGEAVTFTPGTEVWWSAEMATRQAPDADAYVIVLRDSAEVHREYIAADPSFGEWTTLCASEPIEENGAGRYRVEVWDGEIRVLQSLGEYVLTR